MNNKAEYIAITKEAQKQGYKWASGHDLTNIFCGFQQDYVLMNNAKYIITLPLIFMNMTINAKI